MPVIIYIGSCIAAEEGHRRFSSEWEPHSPRLAGRVLRSHTRNAADPSVREATFSAQVRRYEYERKNTGLRIRQSLFRGATRGPPTRYSVTEQRMAEMLREVSIVNAEMRKDTLERMPLGPRPNPTYKLVGSTLVHGLMVFMEMRESGEDFARYPATVAFHEFYNGNPASDLFL